MAAGTALRVLLVEDNDGDARLVREILPDTRAYTITRVNDCKAALVALRNRAHDVALVDLSLPDSDGIRTVRTVADASPELPIIVLTGVDDEVLSTDAIRNGAQDYIPKAAIHSASLDRAIRYAVERKRNEHRLAHINRVLAAVRSVNQLIIRESDPIKLIEKACHALVKTRGYEAAWIALTSDTGTLRAIAQHGWMPAMFDDLERQWRGGTPPACMSIDVKQGALTVPLDACKGCPLPCRNQAVVARIRHGDTTHGVLAVSFPHGIPESEEEMQLVAEIADDLGLGLQTIAQSLARQRADARYTALVENANIGILVARQDTTVLEANRFAADLLRTSTAELVGKCVFDFVGSDSRELLTAKLAELATSGSVQAEGVDLCCAGGERISVDASVSSLDVDDDHVLFVVLRDVTNQNLLRAQLMVSDRMASVGTLAAGVAHEINNPLAVVVANLELALGDMETFVSSGNVTSIQLHELREQLSDATDAASRVRHIVKDLKLFSRAEEDRRSTVDVEVALDSTSRMAWNEIRHRAKLVKHYGHVPTVLANESRLGQVFLNLIVNAAQAIPEGHADKNEITLTTRTDARGRVVVEIRDTGAGMPPDVLKRLFTPFFTTKPRGVGTGLGLAICHRIISGYGGEITVESAPGKGTTFRLVLLGHTDVDIEPVPAATVVPVASRRGRVAVVDDEPMIGTVIRRVLASEHDVTAFTNGHDALLAIRAGQTYDIILCDLMMPVMTGIELYGELVKEAPLQAESMVFLTGGAFTPAARAFLDEVPNLRFEKPFQTQNVRALLNERVH